MTACAFVCTDADHMHNCTCNRCGRRVRVRRLPVNAECAPAPGLGDRVAAALDSAGITKERVAAALGVKDCGCQQRQQWLNEVGYRIGIGTPNPDHTGTTDLDAHG